MHGGLVSRGGASVQLNVVLCVPLKLQGRFSSHLAR
jgi:hypothetical protein